MKKPSTSAWLFVALIIISSTAGFTQSVESPLSLYQTGRSLIAKKPAEAYALLIKAMNVSKQTKDWNVYVRSVNALAGIALAGEKSQQMETFTWAKEAIDVLKEVKRDTAVAELYYNVAEFYNNVQYKIEPSIYHYETAIGIWTSLIGEWNEPVARCYHGMGDVYKYYKLDFHEAEKSYEKALLIRERIHFKNTKVLFRNYYSLAATNRSQRDFEKALSYGSKAMELAGTLGTIKVEETTGMIANIYRDMKESALAIKYYSTALELNKKTKDLTNRAWYYMCLGETFKNDSSYDESLQYFSKAYSIYSTPESTDKNLFLYLLFQMADVYEFLNDEKNVFKTVRKIFRILDLDEQRHSRFACHAHIIVGDHHLKEESYDSALFYYQKAFRAAIPLFTSLHSDDNPTEEMIGFVYNVYEILVKKAATLRAKFLKTKNTADLLQSIDCLKLAEKLLSKQRNTLDMENAKWEFLDANYDLYDDIIASLYEGINFIPPDTLYSLAFRYFEQSKSRSLADALTETERSRQISNQDSLFQLHAELKRLLLSAQDQVNEAVAKAGKQEPDEISRLRAGVVRVDLSIQAVKQSIEEKYPGYFNVKYGYKTPALQDIQGVIRQRKQVILEYFWGSEWVYALGIGENDIILKKLGRPDSIKALINDLVLHLSNEQTNMSTEVFQMFTSSSSRLYTILVKPFKSLLPSIDRIQIIPDGPVSQVPFEVLLEDNTSSKQVNYRALKYLIKSYPIGYAYSSSMFVHKSRKVVRRPSFLAVGFTGGEQLRAAEPETEIQGAERELEALAKRFEAGKFLVGKEATERNFKTLSPGFDIIHLAIHGKGDIHKNFSSSLYFRSRYDSLDDGELHSYELYGLKLKALMAVLSACESGLGKGYRGEGMISMASAFTYSGCENILMSLWKVNDQASTVLMDDFYSQLSDGETIDNALRQAKLNYLETADELTADPKIWAPLVAYGSLDRIFQKDRSSTFIYSALSIVLVLLVIFFVRKKKKQII